MRMFDTTRKNDPPSFMTPTVVGGRRPFRLKFALKVTHPFEKRRLRQISAYNVSSVRYSKKIQLRRTGSRPRNFQQVILFAVGRPTLPLRPHKGWLKRDFFWF